jgi:N-acetylmuramoyl-L-alanine amidase
MTKTRSRFSPPAFLLLLLVIVSSFARAERITIRIQLGERTASLRGYDSSGVMYVSVRDYAATLALPSFNNAEWNKIELRLPDYRVKVTARTPFLVITDVNSGAQSNYQLQQSVLFIDSLYYAPALQFVELLEHLSPSGVKLDIGTRFISKEPVSAGPRFDITGLELEARENGYLLTVKANRKLGKIEAYITSDSWVILTIADAVADTIALGRYEINDVIRRVLIFQSPTSVQLTFQVSPDIVQVDPIIDNRTRSLMLALHSRKALEKAELERKQREQADLERKQQEEKRGKMLESARSRAKLDVIVLDAGHGGKDPGTIGVTGTREKDVALGIALKLGKLIKDSLDIKVVYTRSTDKFVPLDERGTIANEAEGKLFISIHCNSTEHKPSSANGFEIYLLRPGKTESAIRVAEKENAAITLEDHPDRYPELTPERFILVTMRQSAFAKYSEEFAVLASDMMAQELKIQNSGVKQAGFYVLVGASMPNVLVETGYLSHRREEKVLRSAEGQRKIAEALFQGIKEYKPIYEKALQEGQPAEPQGN